MGLTVKRTTDLEKMLGQFTNPATTAEEKKKKDKFLAKNKDKKGQKNNHRYQLASFHEAIGNDGFLFLFKAVRVPFC
ncbi:SPJ_0845 family protein [Pediococcus acidilactici]|uniref:SPJ_0845 family protein n=1 Tax=Pediococcus acidilactici TaxID=1254 RepID=UPI000314FDEA|nr:SPJ_0845 family protein [Pediococcus acidilactici]